MSFLTRPEDLTPATTADRKGKISLVGAGPGAADLLTLRAIRCLGQADVICHDRLVDPEVLAFARPGARLIATGKEVGAHSWPQERIDAFIVTEALAGHHVVRLKSGDPSVFGRAGEEIAAARAHGIAVDIIPGITAASAAAARLCEPLTERGVTDRLVLATATCRPGEIPSDIAEIAKPGTALVFYMAMAQLDRLSGELTRAGIAPTQPVTIARNVEKAGAEVLHTTVAAMARDAADRGITNPAVLMIRIAKTVAQPLAASIPCAAMV
ncbi:uroporphyrin-III C-methyltransferase/precorrin-2 dehydrogenase/sirohydrochlorin ferrochelatase [Rhodobacter viridis]|uniref:uroporphyrinogen-III C-methyltransferase n=1 Tax=Rhodobacter viridis TaxID=1054202 RepID=A0A318U0H7_9RHOB|nr:uroporphyrinogen-III C-methyltransferase [Rhodobacter viridis]PYF08738.1 uroporphyrin-III C-methyltransferase/precorrin-2 dehydrogenase/sirohydrochlorin ferrochelatase [Rhodobacter viridis]